MPLEAIAIPSLPLKNISSLQCHRFIILIPSMPLPLLSPSAAVTAVRLLACQSAAPTILLAPAPLTRCSPSRIAAPRRHGYLALLRCPGHRASEPLRSSHPRRLRRDRALPGLSTAAASASTARAHRYTLQRRCASALGPPHPHHRALSCLSIARRALPHRSAARPSRITAPRARVYRAGRRLAVAARLWTCSRRCCCCCRHRWGGRAGRGAGGFR